MYIIVSDDRYNALLKEGKFAFGLEERPANILSLPRWSPEPKLVQH